MPAIRFTTTRYVSPEMDHSVVILAHGRTAAEVKLDASRQAAAVGARVSKLSASTIYNARADWEAIYGPVTDPKIVFGNEFVDQRGRVRPR